MTFEVEPIKVLEYANDPEIFIKEVLGLEVKWFHKEWLELFENNNFSCLLAPRGHGKTSIVGGYITWKICVNPNIRILIVTINQNKANEMMSFVRSNLTNNDVLIDIFGEQKSSMWSKDKIRVKSRGGGIAHKEPTLQVLGVQSSAISSHYDMIVLDDIQDAKNVATENRRNKVKEWYRSEVFPMLERDIEGGKIINIGTRWHSDDIHSHFEKQKMFNTKVYSALLNPKEVENKGDEESEMLWPEKLPWLDKEDKRMVKVGLKTMKDEMIGETAFQMQYQNKIVQTSDSPMREKFVRRSIQKWNPNAIPQDIEYYIGVDLASGKSDGDYFSMTTVGKDENNNYYIVSNYRERVTPGKQLNLIRSAYKKFKPKKIGIESNAAQRIVTDLWKDQDKSLPIEQLKSSWVNDKNSRAQRLGILFETDRIWLNPRFNDLKDELLTYPRGNHDDSMDSLSFAIQVSELGEEKDIVDWNDVTRCISTSKRKQPFVMKV